MLIFWTIIALMTVLALALILFPLLRNDKFNDSANSKLYIKLYKERLAALAAQLAAKEISESAYKSQVNEVERGLLEEANAQSPILLDSKPSYIIALLVALCLPFVAIHFYLKLGASQRLAQYYATEKDSKLLKQDIVKLGSTQQIIAQLQAHLAQNPTSGQGWFLLGKLYLSNQQFAPAADALAKANQLKPQQPDIIMAYAEALYFADHQSLSSTAAGLLQQLLKIQPNNINAMNLLAVSAYQQKNFQQAIFYWEKLLPLFSPDSTDGKSLLTMIAKAQQQLSAVATTSNAKIHLTVSVTLAAKLKAQTSANEALFVYAQAVGGPAMPLAVVRKQVSDLPLEITLTEQMAMLPNMTLADFKQVEIIARISKSGQAIAQSGDLIGESSVITVAKNSGDIVVTIDKVVP